MKILYFVFMLVDIVSAYWYASDGDVAKTVFYVGMAALMYVESNRE